LSCTVLDARFVKPLDEELFTAEALRHQLVCTIEDHCLPGGFGSAVLELLSDRGVVLQRPLIRIGIPDEFVSHGTQAEQRERYGLSAQGIVARIVEVLGVGEETAKSGEGISQVG